jgi:RHS repeat-associated protein
MKEITDQTDLGSQNSMLIAFGLGDAVTVDEIQIRWPSGVTETLTDIPANQLLEILETKISLPSAESQDDSYPMNETGFSDSHGYYNDFRTGEKLHGPNMENDAGSTATPSGSNMSGVKTSTLVDTYYIYAFDGKLMAEYDHNGNCVKEYIYLGGQLIAEYQPQTSKCYYYASDQINSTRVVLDETADIVHSSAYGPYGQALDNITTTYEPKLKFSGKEREGYSDLDYFGGRYYDHQSFRFNSVDPVINKDEALVNPQLWNLYAYCRNNPITYFDPDGRKVWLAARRLTKAYVGPLFVHSYILIMPNNPKDFKGKTKWAISGYPEKDNLHLDPDNGFDRDFSIKELKGLYEINAPEGKSDTQFIRDIIKSKDRYKDRSRKFSKIPNIDKGEGNCNSLATSVLVGAGVPLEDIKKIDPFGYNPGLGEVFPEMIRKERK